MAVHVPRSTLDPLRPWFLHGEDTFAEELSCKPTFGVHANQEREMEMQGKDLLAASDYHPETWDVRWNVHRLLMGLRVHMTSDLEGEIGSIHASEVTRRILAERSRRWTYDDGK
eukprot:CAMPEP_0118632580 /NCGR_PEP_ID=MMETSP0785-20121206/523_1 /TAXON_ID=91992 /ORGANISM="Bolidomonas pacifica, Strain CCMP 1866" /LENGTH=113 /DNA_ID=CAMNT_0006523365 /DNA_START=297 /DNA_END=636 /DNA_ORIENTATION=+